LRAGPAPDDDPDGDPVVEDCTGIEVCTGVEAPEGGADGDEAAGTDPDDDPDEPDAPAPHPASSDPISNEPISNEPGTAPAAPRRRRSSAARPTRPEFRPEYIPRGWPTPGKTGANRRRDRIPVRSPFGDTVAPGRHPAGQ
jgi:hypothetical protein